MWTWLLSFLLWIVLWLPAVADIPPPFGLEWGESTVRMEKVLSNAGATISQRREIEGRQVWTVSGLKQENLKQTLFYFRNGGLEEVELQYQNPTWSQGQYNTFLGQLRTQVDQRYGAGKLIARSRTPVEGAVGMTQTLVGYHWSQGQSQIEVIYFAAEATSEAYRKVSLHYKAVY